MFGWVLKMLLKAMKPFAGVAIFKMILDAIDSYLGGEGEETTPETSTAAELTSSDNV